MKKIIGLVVVLIAVSAFAQIETSALYQEYVRRDEVQFSGYESAVLSRLQLSGFPTKEIVALKADLASSTFEFENIKGEICKGAQGKDKKLNFTCVSKWAGEDQKLLEEVYESMPKEKIMEMEIFSESGKFVFQTVDREICHGDYKAGKVEYSCLTKAGITSFFAGGDSD